VIELQDIHPRLHDAIGVLERTFMQGSGCESQSANVAIQEPENWSFTYLPSLGMFQDQAGAAWMTAVRRRMPVVWLVQTHSVLDTMANFICHHAQVSPEAVAEGYLTEASFESLTNVCGLTGAAPIRICDIKSMADFKEAATRLARENQAICVMCDWPFNDEEREFARGLAESTPLIFLTTG
jgi:hypothetical protein